jgi:hypothetical protein
MGVQAAGKQLGTIGDVGIFSLGRGKNVTCGSGGIIATDSDWIAAAIGRRYGELQRSSVLRQMIVLVEFALMMAFIRPNLYWIPAHIRFLRLGDTIFPRRIRFERLGGAQAGLLHDWRRRLRCGNRARSEKAAYFGRLRAGGPARHRHPYLRLPVAVESLQERTRILEWSRRRGLGVSAAYPRPVNDLPELRSVCRGGHYPAARRLADTLLTVPVHDWVSEQDLRAIAGVLRRTEARSGGLSGSDRTPDLAGSESRDHQATLLPA